MNKLKLNYDQTYATKHTRDYYRGKSFHFSGKWVAGAHYVSDDYNIDYVVHGQVLLACAKSHLSTIDNEHINLIQNDRGDIIGVASTYWDFVLSGLNGKSPGLKIQDNYWYICDDISVPESQQVWTNTGVKAKLLLEDLTPEEIRMLQEPGIAVVTDFVNNVMTQETGQSISLIMSQKATTDALDEKADKTELSNAINDEAERADGKYQIKGDYATNQTVIANKQDTDTKISAVNDRIDSTNQDISDLSNDLSDTNDKIDSEIERVEGLIITEQNARISGDTSLSNRITQEASTRSSETGALDDRITTIESKIPSQASSVNQLADKEFVNSTVNTNTADFKGTYNTLDELEAQTANNNDYGFVISTDESGNTVYNRYKFDGTTWQFEYALNNSSFTASQWAAIQSGITNLLVEKLSNLPTNSELNDTLDTKVNKIEGKQLSTEDYSTIEKQKLENIEAGAEVNVQSDWNQTNSNSDDYIKNKPQNLVQDANYVHTDNNYTSTEKTKLAGIANNDQVNILEGVQVDGEDLEITDKKVNIDLSGKLDKKVDKVTGKGLSTNDYTDEEKSKLNGIASGAQVNVIESIQINGAAQQINNKTVNLPAYPTTLPASDVYSWAKQSTKPSYNLDEISDDDNVFKVIAEHIAELIERVSNLEKNKESVHTLSVNTIDSRNGYAINGDKTVLSGSGSPTSVPGFVGQFYVDVTNKKLYVATGNSSSSNWTILN